MRCWSQDASNILVNDTRSVDNPPSAYGSNVKFEFKARNVVGMPGTGFYGGVMTLAPWMDNSGNKNHQLGFNDGGVYYRQGWPQGSWEGWSKILMQDVNGNVGIGTTSPRALVDAAVPINSGALGTVFARQVEGDNVGNGTYLGVKAWGTQNVNYNGKSFSLEHSFYGDLNSAINFYRGGGTTGGYMSFATGTGIERMTIDPTGNVGIGTTSPSEKLSVNGNIKAQKLIVTQNGWADYVFDSSYQLKPLSQVESFIQQHKHLPDIPSAKEIQDKGVDVGNNQALLLKKIEELTLYMIEMKKENEQMKLENEKLKRRVENIDVQIEKYHK
jgi:hypothetical protein